jgi:hypothetical protein
MFKAIDPNGEEFVENNQGHYYTYIVGEEPVGEENKKSIEQIEEEEKCDYDEDTDSNVSALSTPSNSSTSSVSATTSAPIKSLSDDGASEDTLSQSDSSSSTFPVPDEEEDPWQSEQDSDSSLNFDSGTPDQKQFIKELDSHKPDQTEKLDFNTLLRMKSKTNAVPAAPSANLISEDNPELVRPIVAYNPFTIEDGNIGQITKPIESFSKIIGFRVVDPPSKKQSFVKHPEPENAKTCTQCKGILNLAWKICPICGSKT